VEAVEDPSPQQRAGDEDAAVGGQDAAEVGVGLEGGDRAVAGERGTAGGGEEDAAPFLDGLPLR